MNLLHSLLALPPLETVPANINSSVNTFWKEGRKDGRKELKEGRKDLKEGRQEGKKEVWTVLGGAYVTLCYGDLACTAVLGKLSRDRICSAVESGFQERKFESLYCH